MKPKIHPERIKKLLAKHKSTNVQVDPNSLFDPNFPQQRNFVDDPAKLKALWCTRRAAKSYTAGLYMVYEALTNPGCNILFVGLTRASAKGIIWKDILRVINKKHGLRATFNQTELTMTFPNGSVIKLTGVNDTEDQMNTWLGQKFRLVCIDESSMYTINLSNFIYGVLKPAMVDPNKDGQRGTICMFGTSSNYARGLFYKITIREEQGWSLHQWTALDNPYVAKSWQEELNEIDTLRPLYKETPQYRQWYLNQWVTDETALVYKYNEIRNTFKDLPYPNSKGWTFNLSVDLGWEDDNAIVLTGYHENDPKLYVIKCFKKNKMTFDKVEAKILEMMADPQYPIQSVIIDGANKQGVETMRLRSLIPFEFASKLGKADHIEMCNGDLIQGKVKIHESCTDLVDEMMSLVWRMDGDKIKLPRTENPSLPNHLCDAFLYGWFNGWHFLSRAAEVALKPGTPEWVKQQEKLHQEAICERMKREAAQSDPNSQGMNWVKDANGRDPWHNWD